MANLTGYYENIDFRYPEIAVCLDVIDRLYPKSYRFRIPSMTPDMEEEQPIDKTIVQNGNNIANEDNNIEIENIELCNYFTLAMPRELVSYIGRWYYIEGEIDIYGSDSATIDNTSISGSVSDPGDFVRGSGNIKLSGHKGSYQITRGKVNLTPIDRYIDKGSKWIIMFVGGDVNKPNIIAPYRDNDPSEPDNSSQAPEHGY